MSKKIISIISTCLLTLVLCFSTSCARQNENITDNKSYDLIKQGILFYKDYQHRAKTDIHSTIDELSVIDNHKAVELRDDMYFWDYCTNNLKLNNDCAPDGLVGDDSLCIVVLGYKLKADGSMEDELVDRLHVAKASAEKYPNSFIFVSGGATADNNKNETEAGQMSKWLEQQGIQGSRIIKDESAMTILQNAENTYKILRDSHKQVKNLVLVSSDYHIKRASLLYHATIQKLANKNADSKLSIVSNACAQTSESVKEKANESIQREAKTLAQIWDIALDENEPAPVITKPKILTVIGNQQYSVGEKPDLQILVKYENGSEYTYQEGFEILNLDINKAGEQIVTIKYTENNNSVTENYKLEYMK